MKTWVFAAGNSLKGIAPELASRFKIKQMEPYTRADFLVVAERVLSMREDTEPSIARLIAATVADRSLDIRDVVRQISPAVCREVPVTIGPWATGTKWGMPPAVSRVTIGWGERLPTGVRRVCRGRQERWLQRETGRSSRPSRG